MADFQASKGPNNHQNYQEKPAIIKTAEFLGVGPKTGKVVFDTKKGVATILVKGDAKKEVLELSEDFKKGFIQKLKQLPDYKGSRVQESIEKGTIEIKKIPDRNGYAIYESKTGNLIYITKLDGSWYSNIDYFRTREILSDFFQAGYLRKGYGKIEFDTKTGLWRLYKKDGKEVPVFSDEYATATLNAINEMIDAVYYFQELIEKKKKEK